MTKDEKAVIAGVIASQISIKSELSSMMADLSRIEENNPDANVQYAIGRAIGQLDAIYWALSHFEVCI